jgi:hypothetical protein
MDERGESREERKPRKKGKKKKLALCGKGTCRIRPLVP